MAKKMGLGRGLSAILPDVEEVVESVDAAGTEGVAPLPAGAVVDIPVGDIDPNRNQPRKKFDDEALLALAESIRHNGVISPILVARDGGRYTIIAGERRWRAARLANLDVIPAIVREWDDVHRQEAALVENIQREDLNAIEEARGIERLMNECALTQEAVAERLGRSRSAVANLLRLLSLPERIQEAVIEGTLSAGHARVLAGIEDAQQQANLFAKTLQFGWSVRQLEAAAKNAPEKREKQKQEPLPVEYTELQDRLRTATGLKVSLEGSAKKGRIILQYGSEDELQRLWELVAH
ncbi:MAG TPA: ParB/RepB/Spo0J family partition protein [Candidatus Ventricola gallistercoris]|nr:ParB/RepB/Spo0J family partition protein [Candidatus Ventricola gallistercoris]